MFAKYDQLLSEGQRVNASLMQELGTWEPQETAAGSKKYYKEMEKEFSKELDRHRVMFKYWHSEGNLARSMYFKGELDYSLAGLTYYRAKLKGDII